MPRLSYVEVISPFPSRRVLQNSASKQPYSGLFFFLGSLVILIILVVLILILCKFFKPGLLRALISRTAKPPGTSDVRDALSVHLRTISYFNFHTLKKATKNFHSNNLLGSGGFGPVFLLCCADSPKVLSHPVSDTPKMHYFWRIRCAPDTIFAESEQHSMEDPLGPWLCYEILRYETASKGKLGDGQLIAVKKLSVDKSQQGEREFLAEVRLITSIQHKNLVRLLGCCSDGAQRLLVYEYMKNRSLDQILYGKSNIFLNWKTRHQIILGIARGLQYLHEDSHIRIVHRDIKASNILLDDKFQPRIGDFGLARFFPEDQAYLSTAFAGTLGYTAPEYAIRGELTEKADIYSFGVLVLEIISCRKNTDLSLPSEMQYLPEYAWKLYERSRLIDLVDPKMQEDGIVEKDVMQTIYIAFLCLQPHANSRPPMSEIVAMLIRNVAVVETPTRPAFLDRKRRNDKKLSWDIITDGFSSPLQSDSPSK